MKKTLIIVVAAFSLVACSTNDKKITTSSGDSTGVKNNSAAISAINDTANFTSLQWIDSTTKDLGKLKKDQTIEITWRFRNNGDKNLVIENVTAGCGCTIPEKPEQPFAPGQEGVIKASFNGSGSGMISKSVTVTANTNPTLHNLTFTGEIKEK